VSWRDFGTTKAAVIEAVLSIHPRLKYKELTKATLQEMCKNAQVGITGNKPALVKRLFEGEDPESESNSSDDSDTETQEQVVVNHYHYYYNTPRR
jgi:hypothetical protein